MAQLDQRSSDGRALVVVGGGVVGLACARAAQREGWRVTVIDRAFEGDRASHGNAGAVAVGESTPAAVPGVMFKALRWLTDPLGPLSVDWRHLPALLPWLLAFDRVSRRHHFLRISAALAALNRRALDDFLAMVTDAGLRGDVYQRGAIAVYETDRAFAADQAEWALRRELGVLWETLSPDAVRTLEPRLAPVFRHAIMISDWAHVADPKRIVEGLRGTLACAGATLLEGQAQALMPMPDGSVSVRLDGDRTCIGDRVIVAAGAWSKQLVAPLGERVLLESERGYNTTLPHARDLLHREVIFSERKFVATPLDIGLRIGGAAEFAGLDAPPNYRRSDALLTLGKRFMPSIDDRDAVRWMGHRPTTPDSLPVIGRSTKHAAVLYAFGHGHLGLTHAASTGYLMAGLLAGRQAPIDLAPYSIARFAR